MPHRIVLIDGHPDISRQRFIHALANAYAAGAISAGHQLRRIDIGSLDLPMLRSNDDFQNGKPPASIRQCQRSIEWADHLVILYPLWLGSMPAMLKSFFEQCMRPGFAFEAAEGRGFPRKLLGGKSARIIVTMGMPAFFYRWYFRAHSLKSLERNILGFCGIKPIRRTLIGMVENVDERKRQKWLTKIEALGRGGN